MNNAPQFDQSFLPAQLSNLNLDYWSTVVKIYEEKKYYETLLALLDYINPQLAQETGNADKTKFVMPHGSIKVYLEITPTGYSIRAPFLRMPEQPSVALMRQIAEINFSRLTLPQIILKGDELHFEYESPLEACEPNKVYRIIEEICINADSHDDIFIEKFGAKRLEDPVFEKVPEEKMEMAWQKFKEYLQEGLAYVDYFEQKRMDGFAWDIMYITLAKIDYFMRPQGALRFELEKAVRGMYGNTPLIDKINKTKAILQKFLLMEKGKFAESIGITKVLISERLRMEVTGVQNYLKKTEENAKAELSSANYMGGTLTILGGITSLLYSYNVPQHIYDTLVKALVSCSQKPWQEASQVLKVALDEVMQLKQ